MLLAALQDSTAVALPPSAPLGFWLTALIGFLSMLGTAGVGKLGTALDKVLDTADGAIRQKLGPALPIVAAALAVAIPLVGNALGLTDLPTATIVANSPLSALIGVVLREAGRKWLGPLVSK